MVDAIVLVRYNVSKRHCDTYTRTHLKLPRIIYANDGTWWSHILYTKVMYSLSFIFPQKWPRHPHQILTDISPCNTVHIFEIQFAGTRISWTLVFQWKFVYLSTTLNRENGCVALVQTPVCNRSTICVQFRWCSSHTLNDLIRNYFFYWAEHDVTRSMPQSSSKMRTVWYGLWSIVRPMMNESPIPNQIEA